MSHAQSRAARPGRRQLTLAAGLVLVALGGWIVQLFVFRRLTTPWYVPMLGIGGGLLALFSFWQSPGTKRGLASFGVAAIGGLAGLLVIHGSLLPRYDGPIAEGAFFPAFVAERAGSGTLTEADLRGQPTVLTFFRGRW